MAHEVADKLVGTTVGQVIRGAPVAARPRPCVEDYLRVLGRDWAPLRGDRNGGTDPTIVSALFRFRHMLRLSAHSLLST